MFFWQATTVLDLMRQHQPKTATLLAGLPSFRSKNFASRLAESYPLCENISIDYAIIEKANGWRALRWMTLAGTTWAVGKRCTTLAEKDANRKCIAAAIWWLKTAEEIMWTRKRPWRWSAWRTW